MEVIGRNPNLRHVLGGAGFIAPGERGNVAMIGAGGQGMSNVRSLLNEPEARIVAVCDVAEQSDLRMLRNRIEEVLERIRCAGYGHVETQATGPWCPHVDTSKDDPQKFVQTVKKYGFKEVTGLWSRHGAIIPDANSEI